MKILREKYPLLDFDTRQKAMNDEVFRMALYTKLATSKYAGDKLFFKEFRKFVDEVANTKTIKTYLIAQTVSDYMFTHAEPIMTKLWNFIPDIPNSTGAILWQDWTYFYRKFDDNGTGVIIFMSCLGTSMELGIVIKPRDDIAHVQGTPPDTSKAISVGFTLSTLVVPFLTFAECETKIINATTNHRTKIHKERYMTNIPSDIEIVDSNWFTTIIRSEGFGVSGHFRLQPMGTGRQERKLIWIKDFEKHGYTKRARLEIKKEKE